MQDTFRFQCVNELASLVHHDGIHQQSAEKPVQLTMEHNVLNPKHHRASDLQKEWCCSRAIVTNPLC